jgi:arylsulfatase
MGQAQNTIVVFTTDNGAETITYPDGGITPFRGQRGESWEGATAHLWLSDGLATSSPARYTIRCLPRWIGDWLPTLVNIAGGPKGDELKNQIEAGQYPGIVKTTLDGLDQRDYLEGKSNKSARDVFFYYSGSTPSLGIKCEAGGDCRYCDPDRHYAGGALQELEVVLQHV